MRRNSAPTLAQAGSTPQLQLSDPRVAMQLNAFSSSSRVAGRRVQRSIRKSAVAARAWSIHPGNDGLRGRVLSQSFSHAIGPGSATLSLVTYPLARART